MGENGEEGQRVLIGKRCFVGNLAWKTSWQDLKDKFREIGTVVYTNVMKDDTGRSKGWGIVEFETPEQALQAINTMNGAELAGRRILVREDREDRDIKNYVASSDNHEEDPALSSPAAPVSGASGGTGGRGGRGRGSRGGRGNGGGRGRSTPPSGESSGLQVVVQGIPWSFTWRELKQLFSDVGEVTRADVVVSSDGRSKGFGTVAFSSAELANKAVEQFHGSDLEGRTLSVFIDKYA